MAGLDGDLLRGAEAIGEFLGTDERQVREMANKGRLPVFRLGRTICARKSTFFAWIAEQERRNALGLTA